MVQLKCVSIKKNNIESKINCNTKMDENISINHIEGIYEYIGEDGLKTNFPII